MDSQTSIVGLVHGLALMSLAAAIGGLVVDALMYRVSGFDGPIARARLRRSITACLVVLALGTLVELVVRTQTMSRAPLAAALAGVPEVVARTHFGAIVGARAVAAILAVLLSASGAAVLRGLCLLLTVGIALSVSLAGHAADWGDLTVSVAVDWLHVVAASAWTGGLFALALVVLRGEPPWSRESFVVFARRFSRLAGVCLAMVVLTGSYNGWVQLGGWAQGGTLSRLWTTAYGQVLIVKVLLVAALAVLGAANRYLIISRMDPKRATPGLGARLFRLARLAVMGPRRGKASVAGFSQLTAYVTREALLAVAVFACTAALGEATPGRHVSFERRPTSHVTPAIPRSSDGGARLGTVTPPAGNASRGRAVFAKLQCFDCHVVRGDRFAAPTRPGPDLTGIGRRHPGYLVESIMNPDPWLSTAQAIRMLAGCRPCRTTASGSPSATWSISWPI